MSPPRSRRYPDPGPAGAACAERRARRGLRRWPWSRRLRPIDEGTSVGACTGGDERQLRIRYLALGGFTAELQDRLEVVVETVEVPLGQEAAVGIDDYISPVGRPTFTEEVPHLTLSAEPEVLECG